MTPTNKILPAVAIAVLMGLSGAMIATAQGLETPAAGATETVVPVQMRHGARDQGDRDHGARDHGARDHGDRDQGDRDQGGRGERGGMMRGEMFRALFTAADADADGSVTAEELAALRTAKVGAADTNADGALTLQEFQTLWLEAMRPRLVDAFQHVDADADASITAAEVDALTANLMARIDSNGDGAISADDRGARGQNN